MIKDFLKTIYAREDFKALPDAKKDQLEAWLEGDYVKSGLASIDGYASRLHFLYIVYEAYIHGYMGR